MVITGLTLMGDTTRWRVEIDEEYWYILDEEILARYGFKEGLEVDPALLDEVKNAAGYRRVRERALYLLDSRGYSRAALVKKLLRNAEPETAEAVADELEELGLIDDEAYAREMARYFVLDKKQGFRRAVLELRRRGIDAGIAVEAVEAVEPEEGQLLDLVRDRYSRVLADEDNPKRKDKVLRALLRLGHNFYDARAAVEAVMEELEEEEE